jgi:hypothetical protein
MNCIFIASAYDEKWRACSANAPDIEYGNFLTNPVRITKQGPQTLSEIAAVHEELCTMAKHGGQEDEDHEMFPSYLTFTVVCDRQLENFVLNPGRVVNLRKAAEQLTILVMRTSPDGQDQITLDVLD